MVQRFCTRIKRIVARGTRVVNNSASERVMVPMAAMLVTNKPSSRSATHPLATKAYHAHEKSSDSSSAAHRSCTLHFQVSSACSSWHPPQSRGRLTHPSQVVQKCFRRSRCWALRSACHCLPLPLHSSASRQRRSFNRNRSVGSHWSSSSAIASVVLSQPENTFFFNQSLANAHSHVVNLCLRRRVWCTARCRLRISSVRYTGNSPIVHGGAARYVNF